MNRIEEAIARAKAQRDNKSETGSRRNAPPPSAAPTGTHKVLVEPEIDLAGLKTIQFDAEALFDNRVIAQSVVAAGATGGKSHIHSRRDAGVAAFKMLRTRVVQRMQSKGWRRLAVASLLPGDGKTLTALNLAISIARDPNLRSVLVELDLRRPTVASCLNISLQAGIESYLLGVRNLEDAVFATSIPGFFVAPAAHGIENSSELLSSPLTHAMLARLKTLGDSTYCVFDLPPMLQADDMIAFAPLVDAVLLVVSEGQTSRDELARAREILGEFNLLGVVLNRSKERMDAYSY